MSPGIDEQIDADFLRDDDHYIVIRLSPDGEVTSISSLDEEDAAELLRDTADEIEARGFDRQRVARLS
jgi:hypothetical protein